MGELDFLTFLDHHRDRDLDNGDVAVVHVLSSVVSAASVKPDLNFPQSLTLTFTFHSTPLIRFLDQISNVYRISATRAQQLLHSHGRVDLK